MEKAYIIIDGKLETWTGLVVPNGYSSDFSLLTKNSSLRGYEEFYLDEIVNGKYAIDTARRDMENLKNLTTQYKGYYLVVVNDLLKLKDYDSIEMLNIWLGDPTFGAEALAIKDWYKAVITKNYQILNDVQNGIIPLPTKDEYLAVLPVAPV